MVGLEDHSQLVLDGLLRRTPPDGLGGRPTRTGRVFVREDGSDLHRELVTKTLPGW
jgi:hypothetical protein